MKRIGALLILAVFLFVSVYTVSNALKNGGAAAFSGTEAAEKSLGESVPFRAELIKMMTKIRYASGVRSFGGICVGNDGSLLRDMEQPDSAAVSAACEGIENFAEKSGAEVYFMLIPTAPVMRQQEVSAYTAAGFFNQRHYINEIYGRLHSSVRTVDVYQALFGSRSEYIYYHTEDLPTSLGGYYIYSALFRRAGTAPKSLSELSVAYVCRDFYGSLATPAIEEYSAPDFISLYELGGEKAVVTHLYADGTEDSMEGIYAFSEDFEDKTDVFFGGLSAVTKIETGLESGKRVLVFCDETAKSWVPFMTLNCTEITLVNLSEATAAQLSAIDAADYNRVIFAYSTAAFAGEDFSALAG